MVLIRGVSILRAALRPRRTQRSSLEEPRTRGVAEGVPPLLSSVLGASDCYIGLLYIGAKADHHENQVLAGPELAHCHSTQEREAFHGFSMYFHHPYLCPPTECFGPSMFMSSKRISTFLSVSTVCATAQFAHFRTSLSGVQEGSSTGQATSGQC